MISAAAAVLTLLAVLFVPAVWVKRDYWRDLWHELTFAWRDVTRELP